MAGLKIRRGDKVRVMSGKDRGKEGPHPRRLPARRAGSSSRA